MGIPNITGFGPLLVKLAMQLAIAAYDDDFSKFNGTLLYANRDVGFERPVFYVYSLDSNLWIVNRGSADIFDTLSCAEFNETTTPIGTFHLGTYNAAQYTFTYAKDYIQSFTGTVYFTGHSYGGTVSPIVSVLAANAFPDKDLNAIAFAGFPMMDDKTNAKYHEKIAMFVNDVDIVPTLSVPNLYNALAALIPFIQDLDEAAIIAYLESWLDTISIFLSIDLYNALHEIIPAVADAIIAYSHGEIRLIRYVPGHAYQLLEGHPKKLSDSEVDPTKVLNSLSLSPSGILEHRSAAYEAVVNEIPNDQRYWVNPW
jgi:hypothetical protein